MSKGFISFGTLFSLIAYFGLFFGLLSGLAFDILLIIAQPANPNSWKTLAVDFAKIISNSQEEISLAAREFKPGITREYANYLIARIIGASLISLSMIYFIYKGIRFFFESPKPTDKIIIILVSILIVYLIGIIAGLILGRINWIPFGGFIDLIKYRENIISYILSEYQKKI